MEQCTRCGEFKMQLFGGGSEECRCQEFAVIDEEGDEYTVYATDERSAAMKHARESNEGGDYYLMDDSVEIQVNGQRFLISAEPDIHYSARAL